MNIKILKLILKNFKGTKSLVADFKGENAAIKGDNGVGKSTINDAFTWILFNKNSAGSKDFNIKTLDKFNEVIHGLDHEVTAILLADGKEITLKKSYKETWTKRRGEAEKTMTGHTTDYFLNEVPAKKGEYEAYISALVDEKIFKLITSPLEFNNLPWKERRSSLLEIVGDVTDINVIESSDKLKRLEGLLGDRKLEDFKKLISSKKKALNDEIKSIPFRVDELVSSVDILGTDFTEKEKAITVLETEITNIDFKVLDQGSIYKENNQINEKIYKLKEKLRDVEYEERCNMGNPKKELQIKVSNIDTLISNKSNRVASNQRGTESVKERLSEIEKDLIKMREDYTKSSQHEITLKQDDFQCPTCKREFEEEKADDIRQEMIENFKTDKVKYLSGLSAKGKKLNNEKAEQNEYLDKYISDNETLNDEIEILNNAVKDLQAKIEAIKDYEFIKTPEYLALEKEIATLEASIKEPNTEYLDELKGTKRAKEREIDSLKAEINQKAQFEKNQIRIAELQEREKELGSMIADLEGQEFLCETFIRTKVDMLEDKINSKFKNVGFKMFKEQVNGGLDECCDVLIGGIPFSDANTGGRINTGLDVISTLCKHYNVFCPIFIDNCESVTKTMGMESQIVKLEVVKDMKLTIETEAIK